VRGVYNAQNNNLDYNRGIPSDFRVMLLSAHAQVYHQEQPPERRTAGPA
jgi:hypothetical protein